jgi:hypothetical protein
LTVAYDARQIRIIAYALALTGGNVASAKRWLDANSVEIAGISESTLRRIFKWEGFAERIAEQAKVVTEEQEKALRDTERERAKRDLQTSFIDRMAAMEAKGWELFERLATEIEKPDTDKRELLAFWTKTQEFVTRLRAHAAPAVSSMAQAEALIRAFREVTQQKCGPALTETILKDVGKRYQELCTAAQAKAAENGEETEKSSSADA